MRRSATKKVLASILTIITMSTAQLGVTKASANCADVDSDLKAIGSDPGSDLWWIKFWTGDIDLALELGGQTGYLFRHNHASDLKHIADAMNNLAKDYAKLAIDSAKCTGTTGKELIEMNDSVNTMFDLSFENIKDNFLIGIPALQSSDNAPSFMFKVLETKDQVVEMVKNVQEHGGKAIGEHVLDSLKSGIGQAGLATALYSQMATFFPHDKKASTELSNDAAGMIFSYDDPVAFASNYSDAVLHGTQAATQNVADTQSELYAVEYMNTVLSDPMVTTYVPQSKVALQKELAKDMKKVLSSSEDFSGKVGLQFGNAEPQTAMLVVRKNKLYYPVDDLIQGLQTQNVQSSIQGNTWSVIQPNRQPTPGTTTTSGSFTIRLNGQTVSKFTPIKIGSALYVPYAAMFSLMTSLGYHSDWNMEKGLYQIY